MLETCGICYNFITNSFKIKITKRSCLYTFWSTIKSKSVKCALILVLIVPLEICFLLKSYKTHFWDIRFSGYNKKAVPKILKENCKTQKFKTRNSFSFFCLQEYIINLQNTQIIFKLNTSYI